MRGKNKLAALSLACAMTMSMVPMFGGTTVAYAAENLISNSTFESGTTGWGIYKESNGKATLSTEDGKLAMKITNVGDLNYACQLNFDIIPLYKNAVYRLSYDISCTTDRFVEGMIQQNGGTYAAYTWKGLNLTQEPQRVDYEFTMEYDTDIMAKMVFNCGLQENDPADLGEHTIYLDNVVLELADDSAVDYEASLPYAPDININQVGYKPDSQKIAVFRKVTDEKQFSVVNKATGEVVLTGDLYGETSNTSANETNWRGDFSAVTAPGEYYISCGALDDSYVFTIAEDVYDKMFDDSIRMLYLQRCGCEIVDDGFGHKACHTSMATVLGTNEKIDVSGGWHDAGDYGRYIVPAAKTIADLLYAYQANPSLYSDNLGIPESGNGIPDVLDEVRFELEWMLKMQTANGGVYHKVSCYNFPGYVMPEDEVAELVVTPVSTTSTADFCASMALAYEFYKDIDQTFADTCMEAAKKAWNFLEENPNIIFKNPEEVTTGEYGDTLDGDERYWAGLQMYRATGDTTYLEKVNGMAGMFKRNGLDWSTVGDYGNIAILTMDGVDTSSTAYTNAKKQVITQADSFKKNVNKNPYGSPIVEYNWGSNMTIANAGIILGLAYQVTGDESYQVASEEIINHLLGMNPNATCYMTGYGTVSPQNPHHRPSMAMKQAMPGMLVGGVNSNLEDSAAKAYCKNSPAAKCYIDNSESYSTNEITIYWNSPLTYLLALAEAEAETTDVVKGDADANGKYEVTDIVMVQRYLLNTGELTNWKNVDLHEDGRIDGFDLAIMKRMMLK